MGDDERKVYGVELDEFLLLKGTREESPDLMTKKLIILIYFNFTNLRSIENSLNFIVCDHKTDSNLLPTNKQTTHPLIANNPNS